MATVEQIDTAQRTWLHAVPWELYEQLREAPENYHVRMTYDQGELEIMSPSPQHEQYARLIGLAIDIWALERDVDIIGCRTMTCKRRDLQCGFEPDNCYYVANQALLHDKHELDFTVDPPPDLALEVDLSGRRPKHKLTIYAAFGVPEVWWFDGQRLRVFALVDGNYHEQPASLAFPDLPLVEIEKAVEKAGTVSDTAFLRAFRDWVRSLTP